MGTDGVWTYGGLTPPATATPIITETQPPALTTLPTPTVTVRLTVTPTPAVTTTLVTTIATPTTTITSKASSGSVGAEGSGTLSSTGRNSPSSTDSHLFPSVNTTAVPTQNSPVNAHAYLGLPPDSFLGLVIGLSVLGLLSLCCCLAGILFCWRRRKKRSRQPNGLTRAERRALLKSHQPLPDPSEREKDASFVAGLANQQSSRLLAGDRSPRDRSFAKTNAPSREMRKSEIALMRARGELPEWNDVPGLSPSLTHLRLADEDPSIAYGVHPSDMDNRGGETSYGRGDRAEADPHMRGSRSRNTSLRLANMPPPPVLRHTPSASGPSGSTYPALSRRPTLGVEPPTITATRPGQTRQHRLESIDSMAGVPESVYYASGVPLGASVAARKSTDELDKEFHGTLDTTFEFDIDHEMRGVDLADLAERGATTPTGSSSDPHLQQWLTADIGDLNDEPPIGALGRTQSTRSSSGSKRSGTSRRTRNLDDVARTAMAYPESPVSETGERSRLVRTPSDAPSPSVSALSPITRYDSPVERTEDIQNLAALPPAGHSPRAAFSNRDSGLGQWVKRTRQVDSRAPEHSRTPLFQRLFDPILTRVRTVSQSARNRPQTPPTGNTARPQEYAALPPEPESEERSSGGISGHPSRDWNWKTGPTSYSSGASTSRDDFRKWGRMGGPSVAAPRSSFGGGSALRQSLIYGSGSNSQGDSRAGLSGDEEADKAERGEGSGLGLAGVPPVPEEQDITSAAPLLRSSSPHTPPRAPIREHAEFGLRPPLPPAPVDHRSSQISARTAGSQATQGTAYFDAKSTLASSARDAARGPSPLGQTAWSAPRSLAGTPMMEPYAVGPQDIPSTSTSTPVQEVTVIEQREPHAPHSPSPPPSPTLATTPQIQHAQPVDVLDVPPPPPATRDFRQQPSLSTVFSVGSLEAFHEALGTGQPEVADHGRRRSSSVVAPGHRQFSGFSALDDSERFPPPGLAPNPRLSYLPFAPPMPESRPPSYGQGQPRPRSADVAQIYQEQLRRLSRASNGAGSQGSVTSSYGEILPGGILSERNDGDDLEEEPPMAANQWRVLRGYRRVSNVPDRGDVEGSGTDSSAVRRTGVGSRQHTISARQAEEQASYRLTLGQVCVLVVYCMVHRRCLIMLCSHSTLLTKGLEARRSSCKKPPDLSILTELQRTLEMIRPTGTILNAPRSRPTSPTTALECLSMEGHGQEPCPTLSAPSRTHLVQSSADATLPQYL